MKIRHKQTVEVANTQILKGLSGEVVSGNNTVTVYRNHGLSPEGRTTGGADRRFLPDTMECMLARTDVTGD